MVIVQFGGQLLGALAVQQGCNPNLHVRVQLELTRPDTPQLDLWRIWLSPSTNIWRSVGHLESDDLEKTTQLFILRYLI